MGIDGRRFAQTGQIAPGMAIMDRADSTNSELTRRVREDPHGIPDGFVLITEDQRSGRGRLDRSWTAEQGAALAMSIAVRIDRLEPADRSWLPLLAGVAAAHAVTAALGPRGPVATLKWPNDVMVDGAKISGILVETVPDVTGVAIVGVGVNTRMTTAQLPVPAATSLAILAGGAAIGADTIDRLAAGIVAGVRTRLDALAGDGGRTLVRDEVGEHCGTIGRPVRVELPAGENVVGIATALGAAGQLMVRTEHGEREIFAGDIVHLR